MLDFVMVTCQGSIGSKAGVKYSMKTILSFSDMDKYKHLYLNEDFEA